MLEDVNHVQVSADFHHEATARTSASLHSVSDFAAPLRRMGDYCRADLVTFLAYWHVGERGFVNLDDDAYVSINRW